MKKMNSVKENYQLFGKAAAAVAVGSYEGKLN